MQTTTETTLDFSPPKTIHTRMGQRNVRNLKLPEGHPVWGAWRDFKDELKASRFSLGKEYGGNRWEITHWETHPGQFESDVQFLASKVIESEQAAIKAKEAMKIDFVAEDYSPLVTETSAKLYDWQKPSCQRIIAALKKGNALDASQTGCHAKGQLILMADGHLKKVEEVSTGDSVMGWDSTPRKVLELKRGTQEMVQITPVKGDSFIVNIDHVLTLQLTNPGTAYRKPFPEIIDVTVREYLTWRTGKKHLYKLFRAPVTCWESATNDMPVNAYHLGVLLGDGCLTTKQALSLSKPSDVMLNVANEIAQAHSCVVMSVGGNINPTHHFRQNGQLWNALQTLGVAGKNSKNKFIPHAYKTACMSDRLLMLAGLLDTDGHMSNLGFDYISASKQLSEDVAFIARSVGLAAYVTPCRKGCQNGFTGEYWRVSISGDTTIIPCRMKNRQSMPRRQKKSVLKTGFSINPLPEDDYYGFTIEGDGRYLLGDFTVTHNSGKTFCALAACAELGFTPFVIAPLAVLESWKRAALFMGVTLGDVSNYDKARAGSCSFILKNKEAKKGERMFAFSPQQKSGLFGTLPDEFKPILIFDECQKSKNATTLQGKLLSDTALQGVKILALSATAAKDPTEMYGIGLALGLHEGGASFDEWAKRNGCRGKGAMLQFTTNPRAAADILQRLHRTIFPAKGTRIRSADVPNYPDNQVSAHLVSSAEIVDAYNDLEHNLDKIEAMEIDGSEKASRTLAEIMKARRISEHGKLDFIIDEAQELLKDGFQVVIFLNFREHLAIVRDALKLRHQPIWGTAWLGKEQVIDEATGYAKWVDIDGPSQKPEERQQIIDDFQNGKAQVCLVSLQAGGAGISLHDVNGIAPRQSLISPSYSAIDLVQCVGRIWRAGSQSKATQRIIYAAGTIEEEIAASVTAKIANIEQINDGDLLPDCLAKFTKA